MKGGTMPTVPAPRYYRISVILVAAAVTGLYQVIVAAAGSVPALSGVQVIVGVLMLLFVPGYALGAILFRLRSRLPLVGELAVTVGLSVVFNAFLGLAYLELGWPLQAATLAVPIEGLAILALGLATVWEVGSPSSHEPIRRSLGELFRFPGYSAGQRQVMLALLLAIVLVLAATFYLASLEPNSGPALSLTLTGPDGTSQSLPTTGATGNVLAVRLSVQNGPAAQVFDLTVESFLANATGGPPVPIAWSLPLSLGANVSSATLLALGSSATGTLNISFDFPAAGSYVVLFLIGPGSGPPLETTSLPLTIR